MAFYKFSVTVKHAGPRMLMLELTPEHITGKHVNES